jgi:RNA polymerase sigma factor for flagellar operon FliA
MPQLRVHANSASSGLRAPEGAKAREERLVRQHLPLVSYIVSEVANRIPRHVSRDDLVSAGMAGLAQAAKSYDPERRISFQRFASARIRGALLDDLRSRDWASRSVRSRARKMTQTTDRLTAQLGRQPSLGEVAEAMGATQAELQAVEADVHRALVLNFEALPREGGSEPAGLPGLDEAVLDNERRSYLVAAVDNLPERLRRVVIGYFFQERPMAALAEEFGVTDSRISQMRAEALALLRDAINSQLDPDLVAPERPGRVAKRRAAYFAAVASQDDFRRRLSTEAGQLARLLQTPEPVAALA